MLQKLKSVLVKSKKGGESEVIDVNIFDNTIEATLTLWASTTFSASTWKPSETILLIQTSVGELIEELGSH